MNRPRPRIFVSSVMTGYQEYREAARAGIRRAGCDPVLAEDFPAQDISARSACLDGVQSADALVLLLGQRFGWVAPSGRSATEEEYQEARRPYMPVLVFAQNEGAKEPDQLRFIAEVEDYIQGHFRRSFQTPTELKRLVKEAVMSADLGGVSRTGDVADGRISEALNRRPPDTQYSVWMKTVWTTLRDEEVVDPLELGDHVFKQRVLRLGHECEPSLLSYERSKQSEATASRLRIVQGASRAAISHEDATILTIHGDGTLTAQQIVTEHGSSQDPNLGFVMMYRLDPNVVRDRLKRAWSFVAGWWNEQDRFLRHDSLLYNVGFYDIGHRSFQDPGDHEPGSGLTIPPECPHNPLIVLDPSRRMSRSDLNRPGTEISRVIRMIELRFREWTNNPW